MSQLLAPSEQGVDASSPFASAPFIVIWEVTRACALACVHCRAEAIPHRDPEELTTEEGERLIDRIAEFGPRRPLFVLTGGDPMRRRDVARLVAHGTARGPEGRRPTRARPRSRPPSAPVPCAPARPG